jgi:hypothetical protein
MISEHEQRGGISVAFCEVFQNRGRKIFRGVRSEQGQKSNSWEEFETLIGS